MNRSCLQGLCHQSNHSSIQSRCAETLLLQKLVDRHRKLMGSTMLVWQSQGLFLPQASSSTCCCNACDDRLRSGTHHAACSNMSDGLSKQELPAKLCSLCTYCMYDCVAGIIVLLLPEPVPDVSHATTYAAHTVNHYAQCCPRGTTVFATSL